MNLVFATNNKNKLIEIQQILGTSFHLFSLKDVNCNEEIPETRDTLEGNASQKSHFVYDKYGNNCFADDTGLEIEALNGKPGVLSARYAGADKDSDANMNKVLRELIPHYNRKAQFRTVISLILDGKEFQFEGAVEGNVIYDKRGTDGFGYDPIFVPVGYNKSFAQMNLQDKNEISHRARAFRKLVAFLQKQE